MERTILKPLLIAFTGWWSLKNCQWKGITHANGNIPVHRWCSHSNFSKSLGFSHDFPAIAPVDHSVLTTAGPLSIGCWRWVPGDPHFGWLVIPKMPKSVPPRCYLTILNHDVLQIFHRGFQCFQFFHLFWGFYRTNSQMDVNDRPRLVCQAQSGGVAFLRRVPNVSIISSDGRPKKIAWDSCGRCEKLEVTILKMGLEVGRSCLIVHIWTLIAVFWLFHLSSSATYTLQQLPRGTLTNRWRRRWPVRDTPAFCLAG